MDTLGPLADALIVPALLMTFGYLATCVFWPFKSCRICQGFGQLSGWLGGIRLCGACGGTGLRLRLGRRLINSVRRLYREINSRRDR